MLAISLASLLLLAPAPPEGEPPTLRTVSFVAEAGKGRLLKDLQPTDVAVLENGTAREIVRLERDERPLAVLVLIDTSEQQGSGLRLNLSEALLAFVAALPDGARYALWKTSDRPTRLLDFTDDRDEAKEPLKRLFPQGGNTFLDGLAEGAQAVLKQEGARSALVAVTGTAAEFSSRSRERAVEEALAKADVIHVLQIDEGQADLGARSDYEWAINQVTSRSGGRREYTLTSMAARKPLLAIADELASGWRLTYVSDPALKRPRVEVQLARPEARARVSPPKEER